MRISHIGPDSQFLQFSAAAFERVAPGANEQVVLSTLPPEQLRFPLAHGRTRSVSPHWRSAPQVADMVRGSDLVVAHSMTPHAAAAFLASRRSTRTVWRGWGYDYYYSTYGAVDPTLMGPRTTALHAELHGRTEVGALVRSASRRLTSVAAHALVHRAAARADFFSAPIPSDETVFRSRFPRFGGEYTQLHYASLEETFALTGQSGTTGDVLVGNSASWASNHLEVFEQLARGDLGGRRVIVPLSYGDAEYRDAVIAAGRRMLGGAFVPLTEFLPLHEYSRILGSCDVVVMNHVRQQALGNIGTALHQGASVYLHPRSPVLEFLRSHGATVFAVNEIGRRSDDLGRLSGEAAEANREVLSAVWGEDVVAEGVARLLARVTSP